MRISLRPAKFFVLIGALALSACQPAELIGLGPKGKKVTVHFYPGGFSLDDLVIIDGDVHFGNVQYRANDPMSDLAFRFKSGNLVKSTCTLIGFDSIGDEECKKHTVTESDFEALPVGLVFRNPSEF